MYFYKASINMNKKIKYLSACLLSILMMTSSFGCTFVVHSCSISGNSTISINKIDATEACGDCCDDNSESHSASIEGKCCTEMSYCNYFPTEANQSIQSSNLIKLSNFQLNGLSIITSLATIVASQKTPSYWTTSAPIQSTQTSILKKICKLQI